MAEKKKTTSARLKTKVKPQSNVSVKSNTSAKAKETVKPQTAAKTPKTKAKPITKKVRLKSRVKGTLSANSNFKIKTKSSRGGKTRVSFTAPRNAKIRIKKV